MVPIRSFSPASAPVLHEPLRGHRQETASRRSRRMRRFDITDDSRDLPSLAIRPQDRVHVDIRHAAPKLQVGVRDGQERPRGRSRLHRRCSRPCRRLQVPNGRYDHGCPQTSIATLLRRFSAASLAHRAHATLHHHRVRSRHRRSLAGAPSSNRVNGPVRAREPCRAALREFRPVMDMRVGARHGRSDTTAKVGPVGAHPRIEGHYSNAGGLSSGMRPEYRSF
jgi:hypothetical protein